MYTTQDLLYVVISFCIIWVTVFLCWTFYYLMRLLRTANQIVDEFREKLESIMDTMNYVRGKVEHISGLMTLATGGMSELLKKVVTKKAKQWVDGSTEKFNDAAKEAVDKAVEETAKRMKKASRRMRNS